MKLTKEEESLEFIASVQLSEMEALSFDRRFSSLGKAQPGG
jgi:hypothetical protein